jgi:hypothetical protein
MTINYKIKLKIYKLSNPVSRLKIFCLVYKKLELGIQINTSILVISDILLIILHFCIIILFE